MSFTTIPCSNESTKSEFGARANKGLICTLPGLYSTRACMIKPRFRRRKRFDSIGDICLQPGKHGFCDTYCDTIRVTRTESIIPTWEVSKEIRKLRTLSPFKVPKTAGSWGKRRRRCIRGGNSNKTVVRGAKRGRDRVRV